MFLVYNDRLPEVSGKFGHGVDPAELSTSKESS